MKKLFILFLLPFLVAATTISDGGGAVTVSDGGGSTAVAEGPVGTSYYFRETFNGSTEDNTWDTWPTGNDTGTNDDYTTTVLEGAQSVWVDVASSAEGSMNSVAFDDGSASIVYARVAFRVTNDASTTTGPATYLTLHDSAEGLLARAYLQWHTGGAYRIYSGDGSGTTLAAFSDDPLSDGTYYLQIIYTKGTSVKGSVMDSDGTTELYTSTHTTTESDDVDYIGIGTGSYVDCIFDIPEVRGDTSWGS